MCVCVCVCMFSHSDVSNSVTPWTVPYQTALNMGFPRQEYWSGLPFPPPRDLPNPGIEAGSLVSPTLASGLFTNCTTWEAHLILGITKTKFFKSSFSSSSKTHSYSIRANAIDDKEKLNIQQTWYKYKRYYSIHLIWIHVQLFILCLCYLKPSIILLF